MILSIFALILVVELRRAAFVGGEFSESSEVQSDFDEAAAEAGRWS